MIRRSKAAKFLLINHEFSGTLLNFIPLVFQLLHIILHEKFPENVKDINSKVFWNMHVLSKEIWHRWSAHTAFFLSTAVPVPPAPLHLGTAEAFTAQVS